MKITIEVDSGSTSALDRELLTLIARYAVTGAVEHGGAAAVVGAAAAPAGDGIDWPDDPPPGSMEVAEVSEEGLRKQLNAYLNDGPDAGAGQRKARVAEIFGRYGAQTFPELAVKDYAAVSRDVSGLEQVVEAPAGDPSEMF